MTVSITIRNVPDETRDELASRAALKGQSMQEYVLARLIDIADKPDIGTWLEQARAIRTANPTPLSAEQILEYRDAGRR